MGTTDYVVQPAGYVGTVEATLPDLEATLYDAGFRWDPFSLHHRTPAGTTSDGSWAYRDSLLADRQLHVVLFERATGRIDVYAHDEPNWLRHPIGHAGMDDIRRERESGRIRRWLDELDVAYERESIVVRKFEHVRDRLRLKLAGPDPGA